MQDLARNGSVIVIENDKGEIVGASMSYPLITAENGTPEYKYMEMGTTRMSLNGYPGLFDMMISLQVLRAFLVEPPSGKFVCQMEGAPVRAMAHKLGFRPFVPSDELSRVSDGTVGPDASYGKDNWYCAGPEVLHVMAQRFFEAKDKPCIAHVKTGHQIEIDLSKIKVFGLFEPELRKLAQSQPEFTPDNPDPKASLSAERQKFMHRFFK
jgi:hypothetical protein